MSTKMAWTVENREHYVFFSFVGDVEVMAVYISLRFQKKRKEKLMDALRALPHWFRKYF